MIKKEQLDNKKIIRYLWVCIITGVLVYALIHPDQFSQNTLYQYLIAHKDIGLLLLLSLHLLRGLILLPSTPLILAGSLLYPNAPLAVLLISIIGILASSSLIYWFADRMDFKAFFSNKEKLLIRTQQKLSSKYGFGFIVLWSFFPIVPTDLICYVAGILRLNFGRFILALALGELILCSFYIFGLTIFN